MLSALQNWKKNFVYHITYKPEISYHKSTNIVESVTVKRNGKLHNIELPAYIEYYKNGNVRIIAYYLEGEMCESFTSLPNGNPAYLEYYKNGNIQYIEYYYGNEMYRPPITLQDKTIFKPAMISYYKNGNIRYEQFSDYENQPLYKYFEYYEDGQIEIL